MPRSPDNGPSALVRGVIWASRISTLTFELAGPIFAGYWFDLQWKTSPWLLLLGSGLGLTLFCYGVYRLSQDLGKKP